jgi:succinate-semialdehyde dehydrogenase/glutarate-semialdehyde dehydrogenase
VRSIKFVGSTAGGKKVAEIAGRAMKRGAYELGGSDPCIIFEDADLELATTKGMIGRLHSNGQACNNHKRFLI